jgi:hypothetical protein
MEALTNDQLIALLNGGPMGLLPKLAEAAQAELLKRLNPGKSQIDSLFDMEAIKKQFDEIYYQIKDLHERIDQVTKKMLGEFGEAALKAGSAVVFNTKTKTPASNPEKATEAAFFNNDYSKYAPNCKVTVPEGWIIFKGDKKIEWTDKDMLNFVGISISKDEAYLKKLLEEYRNA